MTFTRVGSLWAFGGMFEELGLCRPAYAVFWQGRPSDVWHIKMVKYGQIQSEYNNHWKNHMVSLVASKLQRMFSELDLPPDCVLTVDPVLLHIWRNIFIVSI